MAARSARERARQHRRSQWRWRYGRESPLASHGLFPGGGKRRELPIPEQPVVFMKNIECAVGHQTPILVPKVCEDELDFECELARGLRMNRHNLIFGLLPDLTNPFFANLARHLRIALEANAFEFMTEGTEFKKQRESEILEGLPSRYIDGVFPVLGNIESHTDYLKKLSQPSETNAQMASSILLGRITGQRVGPASEILMPTRLLIRSSTGLAPAQA